MTCHCFLRLIRRDLTSSSYITEKSCVVFVPVTHIFLKYITTHTHTVTLESQFSCGLVEPIMPYTNSWSNKILVVWSYHSCRYTAPWVEKCWLCCSTLLRSCEQKIPGIDQRLSNSLGISSKNIQGLSWIGPRFANKRKTWCNQCSLDGLKKQYIKVYYHSYTHGDSWVTILLWIGGTNHALYKLLE